MELEPAVELVPLNVTVNGAGPAAVEEDITALGGVVVVVDPEPVRLEAVVDVLDRV